MLNSASMSAGKKDNPLGLRAFFGASQDARAPKSEPRPAAASKAMADQSSSPAGSISLAGSSVTVRSTSPSSVDECSDRVVRTHNVQNAKCSPKLLQTQVNLKEHDPDEDRRKRRRTVSPAPRPITPLLGNHLSDNGKIQNTVEGAKSPKKMLQLKANGLLKSPDRSAEIAGSVKSGQSIKRGRKPKKPASLIVKLSYGHSQQMKDKIKAILEPTPAQAKVTLVQRTNPSPAKKLHPFFGGGRKRQDHQSPEINISGQNSAQPKQHAQLNEETGGSRRVQGNMQWSSTERATAKPLGGPHALWPCQGMVHCRGTLTPVRNSRSGPELLRPSKLKSKISSVTKDEDLLENLSFKIARLKIKNDGLKHPTRVLMPGDQLAHITSLKMRTTLGAPRNASESTTVELRRRQQVCHVLDGIETMLTPFDQCRRESQAWSKKYAPKSAGEVLQQGREALLLRDWLKGLTVKSVDVGLPTGSSKERPKKRKKQKELDDFIVNSDDSDGRMDELTDPEDTACDKRKSTIWTSKAVRHRNVVVLSGPPGCGKTAAVYAAAKELNFEVFEINSGSKRSGKEIMESVGDMTRNHLVRSDGKAESADSIIEIEEHVKEEVRSGRQDTMNSFFKAKPKKPFVPIKKQPSKPKETATKAARAQKQSLILLEEVDILFEEDKQFWSTVLELIERSKRPVILTCNDEACLPLDDLDLHAIFRFTPPPSQLMTDYLLAIAAKEGHILERDAVGHLVKSRNHDLRASIVTLDFWCQMAVGDRRGGLEWLYQRWPIGSDRDAQGRVLKVVSSGTFEDANLWPRSVGVDSSQTVADDRTLETAWLEYGLDPGDWADVLTREGVSLDTMALVLDTASAMDIYSGPSLRSDNSIPLDPSLPSRFDRSGLDKLEGYTQLDDVPLIEYSHLSQDIAITLKAIARRLVCDTPLDPETLQRTPLTTYKPSHVLDGLAPLVNPHPAAFPGYTPAYSEVLQFPGTVASEVAPYIRAIARADLGLAARRRALNTLLSEGGRPPKKLRTTRASRSALEGGVRETTRREKWFGGLIKDYQGILQTAGEGWHRQREEEEEEAQIGVDAGSGPLDESDESDSSGIDD